jgi:CRISPR/Cas system-associated exonuclease Cas4 (RecB family)
LGEAVQGGMVDGIMIGNHVLVGVIDQVDNRGKVIDYKTGAKPTKTQLDFDLQFTIYSYAYRKIFGKRESGLILRHLTTCSDITTERKANDFKFLASEIDKIERSINNDIFVRNLSRGCAYCYFLEACLGKERQQRRRW